MPLRHAVYQTAGNVPLPSTIRYDPNFNGADGTRFSLLPEPLRYFATSAVNIIVFDAVGVIKRKAGITCGRNGVCFCFMPRPEDAKNEGGRLESRFSCGPSSCFCTRCEPIEVIISASTAISAPAATDAAGE